MQYFKMYKKDKCLYVGTCDIPVKASYSQIPLEYSEYLDIVKSGYFTNISEGDKELYRINRYVCAEIKNAAYWNYMSWFKEKVAEYKRVGLFEAVPNKIYKLDIPGTSKLIRSPDKGKIKIARRKVYANGKVDNECRINVLPITNEIREEFFADCNERHRGDYVLWSRRDRDVFGKWSDLMDEIYKELDEEAKQNKS